LDKLSELAHVHTKVAEGIQEIRTLMVYMKAFHVPTELLTFDASLVYMFPLYNGLIFQATLPQGDIIAAGGRYDDLISRFSPPNSVSTEPAAAVGINVYMAKLLSRYYAHERVPPC